MKKLFRKFFKNEKGMISAEIAFATPLLLTLALTCVEATSFVLFTQKMDRAVTAMGDLTAQARGLTQQDLANLYDAAEYIMRPFDLDANGSVIVSSISPDDDVNPLINWQWSSGASASKFGLQNEVAELPNGFVVRDGESVIVSEIYVKYDPVIFTDFASLGEYYQFSIFRPRFDALTALD